MIEESDIDPNIDGIDHASQMAGEANVTLQKPNRHQIKRNNGVVVNQGSNNYYVVSPGTGQQNMNPDLINYQTAGSNNLALRQSIDKKMQGY